jgi:hypothetical protein
VVSGSIVAGKVEQYGPSWLQSAPPLTRLLLAFRAHALQFVQLDVGDVKSSLGDVKSSQGDANIVLGPG